MQGPTKARGGHGAQVQTAFPGNIVQAQSIEIVEEYHQIGNHNQPAPLVYVVRGNGKENAVFQVDQTQNVHQKQDREEPKGGFPHPLEVVEDAKLRKQAPQITQGGGAEKAQGVQKNIQNPASGESNTVYQKAHRLRCKPQNGQQNHGGERLLPAEMTLLTRRPGEQEPQQQKNADAVDDQNLAHIYHARLLLSAHLFHYSKGNWECKYFFGYNGCRKSKNFIMMLW